jgi:hypothetical protein
MTKVRRTDPLQLAALGLLGLLLTVEAPAQEAYTDGKAAQLKASDIKKLKALSAPIAVPTYVPAGSRLKGAGGRSETIGTFWSVDYWLNYQNAKGDIFDITSSNEGLGDLPITDILTGTNPLFDGVIRVGTQVEEEEIKKGVAPDYETGWIGSQRAYLPAGSRSREQAYRMTSTALSPGEILKVMMSLRYLK